MPYAVTTQGQGADAFIAIPAFSINAGTNINVSGVELDVKPLVGSSAGFVNLLGSSSTNTTALRINTATQTLQWRYNSTVYLESPAGSVPLNERHKYGVEWEEVTLSLYLTKNGTRIAGPYVAPSAGSLITNVSWSQIGKVGSTAPGGLMAFELYGIRIHGNNSTYQAQWDDTGASNSGTSWSDDSASRVLTLTSFTGAANSWWLFYSNAEERFGTFTATATITRALSSAKQALGLYSSSLVANSSWTVEPSSYGNFSTAYSIGRSFTSNKEIVTAKPNQSFVISKNFTQGKESVVAKPTQTLFINTGLTQSKQSLVTKPTQSLLAITSFTQAKEVNVAKPNTFLNESANFTWEVFYGVGGSFSSIMQLTKAFNTSKASTSTFTETSTLSSSLVSSKEAATAFAAGLQSGFSGVSSEKQAVSNIYAEMTSSFSITSTTKASSGLFQSMLRIDGRIFGGTDEANAPRIITYTTNALSKRFYSTNSSTYRII